MKEQAQVKILLVDDDQDMCSSLSDVLSFETGYKVLYSTVPMEALEILKKEEFSLVIIDYKMPEMNGLELLNKIKSIRPGQKVFMLTAFISTELIEQAKKAGADEVLSKFIWPDEILKLVSKTIS
ncbi:MAG: response regulator [Candidatus Omnitrophica bacterium]|nr:response regulator [Candidatus Omnitrophota bacterium]MDD5487776.1 response regulator [Candidatus Omnitrophota bacterium]